VGSRTDSRREARGAERRESVCGALVCLGGGQVAGAIHVAAKREGEVMPSAECGCSAS